MKPNHKIPRIKELRDLPTKTIVHTMRIPPEEYKQIKSLADEYAGGNVSAWFRYSARKYIPSQSELAD